MHRRTFLSSAAMCAALPLTGKLSAAAAVKGRRTAAVIGHTGRGNYGHGLDSVWKLVPDMDIVGVADASESGLKSELRKLDLTAGGNTDYGKMLAECRPEFVSVCPRYADQHCDMVLAAIDAGVKGIYVEKPFVRTPEEADRILAAAQKQGTKIAVAHRNAWHPALKVIADAIANGDLGIIREIRGRGKGDRRGGAEDLWVLGTHVFNLMEFFGGIAQTCSAELLQDGRPVTAADVRDGAEGLGPLAGNELHARYRLAGGITATFDSIANDGFSNAGFGLQLVGTKGLVNIQVDVDPVAYFVPGNPFAPTKADRPWIPVSSAGIGVPEKQPERIAEVHNHVAAVTDLIRCCDSKAQPVCDAHAAARTVDMVCAVFESHRQEGRTVSLPLTERRNPLTLL
ncbi:MAG: Gfo/Idh/MocA family oxidoreductase [Planctomycetaceae bacterium]